MTNIGSAAAWRFSARTKGEMSKRPNSGDAVTTQPDVDLGRYGWTTASYGCGPPGHMLSCLVNIRNEFKSIVTPLILELKAVAVGKI